MDFRSVDNEFVQMAAIFSAVLLTIGFTAGFLARWFCVG